MIPFDLPEALSIVELAWPTRVVLGPGALTRLPAHLAALGVRRPLVVTDPGVVRAGIADQVHGVLEAAGMRGDRFDEVQPNPGEEDVERGLAAWRRGGCDGLVGVGGGSALDVAKLVQLRATHEPPLSRYDDASGGDRFVRGGLPPLAAIPTTAGTGSEVGRSAVVTLADTGRKTVIFSPHLLPRVAICDPRLTLGLPAGITAATGMDAFTHGLEAYLALGFHPLADAVGLDAVRRAARSLPVAVHTPGDLHARTDMMVAALEGAMAFQKGLGAAHALAHALGPVSGLHHGLANAVVLPAVVAYLRPAAGPRLARIAAAMGADPAAGEAALADGAAARVRALAASVGIPARLRDAGVREADLPRIAAKAFEDASHRGSARPCGEADLLALATAAF